MRRFSIQEDGNGSLPLREYSVRETAKLTGLSEHTLRYYEKVGLIASVRRDRGSRHRRYTTVDLARIEALACLRLVGMPIEDMRHFSRLEFEDPRNAAELREILERQRRVLEERRAQIDETIRYVDMKTEYLDALTSGDEARIDKAMGKMRRNLEGINAKAKSA